MTAHSVRVDVESRGISHVSSSRVRNDRDIIADLLVLRIPGLRIERIAGRYVGRPRNTAIYAVSVEQLHIGVIRGIARIQPHHVDASIGCY